MTRSLQKKHGKYYAVLNFYANTGWLNLDLPVKESKRRAALMLRLLTEQYQGIASIEPIGSCWGSTLPTGSSMSVPGLL